MACLGRQPGRGCCFSSNGGAGCGPAGVEVANRLWNDGGLDCVSVEDIARNGIRRVALSFCRPRQRCVGMRLVLTQSQLHLRTFNHGLIEKDTKGPGGSPER